MQVFFCCYCSDFASCYSFFLCKNLIHPFISVFDGLLRKSIHKTVPVWFMAIDNYNVDKCNLLFFSISPIWMEIYSIQQKWYSQRWSYWNAVRWRSNILWFVAWIRASKRKKNYNNACKCTQHIRLNRFIIDRYAITIVNP